jgi:hypothetical protein
MELYSTNPSGILKPHQGIGKPTRHKRLSDAGSTLEVRVLPTPPTISRRNLLKWADDGTRRS